MFTTFGTAIRAPTERRAVDDFVLNYIMFYPLFTFVDQHIDVHLHVGVRDGGGQVTFVRAFVALWSAPRRGHRSREWGTAPPVTPPAPVAVSRDARHLGSNKRLAVCVFFGGCVCTQTLIGCPACTVTGIVFGLGKIKVAVYDCGPS